MVRGIIGQVGRRLRLTASVFRGGGQGWTLLTVASGWFLVVGTLLTIPALLPYIRTTFTVSNTTAGIAISIMWAMYALFQFPGGILADRIGERRVLIGGLIISGASVVGLSVAPTFIFLLIAVAGVGGAGGLFGAPRVTLVSRMFPDNDGTALGIVMGTGSIGAAVLPAAAGIVAVAIGFQAGVLLATPLFAMAILAAFKTLPPARTQETESAAPQHLVRKLMSALVSRGVALATVAVTLTFFSFQGVTAFLTTYLTSMKNISPEWAATLFGLLFAAAATAQPLAGSLADRFGDRPVLVTINASYALLLAILPFVETPTVAVVVVLLGVQRGSTPVAMAYLSDILPPEVRGSGFGLLRTVFTGVASTGAILVGTLVDANLFDSAFFLLSSLVAVASGCYVLLPSRE